MRLVERCLRGKEGEVAHVGNFQKMFGPEGENTLWELIEAKGGFLWDENSLNPAWKLDKRKIKGRQAVN